MPPLSWCQVTSVELTASDKKSHIKLSRATSTERPLATIKSDEEVSNDEGDEAGKVCRLGACVCLLEGGGSKPDEVRSPTPSRTHASSNHLPAYMPHPTTFPHTCLQRANYYCHHCYAVPPLGR